ncbi:MAG: RNA methyltransferase [Alphaproteobacteria bacterium]|nr:RNA methyltransferase [Alphaproteobacteria bacterium]
MSEAKLRGYFGIGVEGISKQMNVGAIMRTAHAFGASFVFTIDATYAKREGGRSDTSNAPEHLPLHEYDLLEDFSLPRGCALVGIELIEDSIDLPSFRHPRQAAYVLGPERGSLSPALIARCDHVVKVPTRFCVNVGLAAAIVMYDRLLTLGRYPARPLVPGGPTGSLPDHVHGGPVLRRPRGGQKVEQ